MVMISQKENGFVVYKKKKSVLFYSTLIGFIRSWQEHLERTHGKFNYISPIFIDEWAPFCRVVLP